MTRGHFDSFTPDGGASDPYTEARWDQPDKDRKSWLDAICKRELEISRAARELARQQGKSGGKGRPPVRVHALRPGTTRTYCGRRVGPAGQPGVVSAAFLGDRPTCRNCKDRVPQVAPPPAES